MDSEEFFSEWKTYLIVYLFILTVFYIPTLAYQGENSVLLQFFVFSGIGLILVSLFYLIRGIQLQNPTNFKIGLAVSILIFILEIIDIYLGTSGGSPSFGYFLDIVRGSLFFIIINVLLFYKTSTLEEIEISDNKIDGQGIGTTISYLIILGVTAIIVLFGLIFIALSGL